MCHPPVLDIEHGTQAVAARPALGILCATGFVAYCSYAMCRSPLLPLFARDLGAEPALIGVIVGASTLTGIGFTGAINLHQLWVDDAAS